MEKLKSMIRPGGEKDDAVLYGDGTDPNNKGKIAGEGSHFDSSSTAGDNTTGIANTGNDASSTTAVKGGIPGETQAATSSSAHPQAQSAAEKAWGGVDRTGDQSDSTRTGYDSTTTGQNLTGAGTTGTSNTTPLYDQYASTGPGASGATDPSGLESTTGSLNPTGTSHSDVGSIVAGDQLHHEKGRGVDDATAYESPAVAPHTATGGSGLGSSSDTGAIAGGIGSSSGIGSSTTGASSTNPTSTTDSTALDSSAATGVSSAPLVGSGTSNNQSTSSTTGGTILTGPVHDSAFLNKLDPRVKEVPAESGASGITGTPVGASEFGAAGAAGGVASALPDRTKTSGESGHVSSTTQSTSIPHGATSSIRGVESSGAGVGSTPATETTGSGLIPGSVSNDAGTPSGLGSSTTGHQSTPSPYSSHAIDPRVNPSSTSDQTPPSHLGRDAALGAGALGAAGTGYEATRHHDGQTSTVGGNDYAPTTSSTAGSSGLTGATGSHLPTSTSQSTADNPGTSTYTTGAPSSSERGYDSQAGTGHQVAQQTGLTTGGTGEKEVAPEKHVGSDHNYGRDAAVGAGALGATGAGYEATKHHGQPTETTSSITGSSAHAPGTASTTGAGTSTEPLGSQVGTGPSTQNYGDQSGYATDRSTAGDQKDHHYGRDAALGAGAVGAGGLAAHEVDNKAEEKRMEKEQHEQAKEAEKRQHEADKEAHKHEKAVVAEHKKEEKHHEKEVAKEEKKQEKEEKKAEKEHEKAVVHEQKQHEKEEKEHEKAIAHEQKEQEKENKKIVAAQEKEEKKAEKKAEKEEKKEEKEEKKAEKEAEKEEKKEEKEEEHDHEGKKKGGLFGFLHKDKSKTEEHEPATHQHEGETRAPGTAGWGGMPDALEEHARHGDRNRLHKDPPDSVKYAQAPTSGYASEVTGGTGTSALAQGDNSTLTGSHATGLGNKLDPAQPGIGSSLTDERANVTDERATGLVTDNKTGLPMDLGEGGHKGYGTDGLPHGGQQ